MIERLPEQNQNLVVPVQTYTVLKPGSTQITFRLRNLSARTITVTSWSIIAKFTAANAIPILWLLILMKEKMGRGPLVNYPYSLKGSRINYLTRLICQVLLNSLQNEENKLRNYLLNLGVYLL